MEHLPEDAFYLFNGRRHGRVCKECKKKYTRKWASDNRVKILKRQAVYRKENFEAISAVKKKAYLRKRQHYIDKTRQWAKANPERRKAIAMKWAKLHPEAIKEAARRRCRDLMPCYVRYVLTKDSALNASDIPQELVDAKREQLKIRRIVRNERKNSRA
jgi:hypothetical protein